MHAGEDNPLASEETAASVVQSVVLHVDDDMSSLIMAEGTLEDAGFAVVHASNGREALDRYQEHQPDFVIMDAEMPVMDGFEAIRRIRQLPGGEHVPILMTTGLDDLDSITRAYDEGATDFVTKPVNFFILPHRVQYMLRSKVTADELRASQEKLDKAQRIAKMGNWEWDIESGALNFSHGFLLAIPAAESAPPSTWSECLHLLAEPERSMFEQAALRAVRKPDRLSIELSPSGGTAGQKPRTIVLEGEPQLDANGKCTHLMGTVQDVTEHREAQAQIHNLAYFDITTGLPNRARLLQLLGAAVQRADQNNSKFAVLFVDLDHFKQVNDTLGHDAGDLLLQMVSERITDVLRSSDLLTRGSEENTETHTIARLGGDEFVVLLDAIRRPEDSARVAQRLAGVIREPFHLDDNEVSISSTIGISVFPADGTDSATLLKHADVAMYHAKERGRDGYQFYSRGIHERALQRFSLEKDLKRAIGHGELDLVFQPKVEIATGRISGCEALVRWLHPERGPVSPCEFIPLAEDTGLILPLGQWVLARACRQMQQWHQLGDIGFGIAVNCSAVQFTRGDMEKELDTALKDSGLAPHLLEVELTESLLMHDINAGIASLQRMKALGVKVSIDDFGAGFSSLSYLKRLPADKLKIDQCFVKDLDSDAGDKAIVVAVTKLSHDLGLTVVAEGVETREQFGALRELACDEAQGYLISKPLAADALIAWVREQGQDDDPRWLADAA